MTRTVTTPTSLCRFGLARADITPPVGIYHRMWGAATHEQAEGVHRPLEAAAMVFAPRDAANPANYVLVALDHCLFWHAEMSALRQAVLAAHKLPAASLLITFSHTHAAGLMDPTRRDLPGGDLIEPYLAKLTQTVIDLVGQALAALQPATLSYVAGRCNLAGFRDTWDAASHQFVCGLNPDGPADDTVVVTRVMTDDGEPLATVVNYACHPTTLAWENRLISPDYPGALRESVERETGAPCVFLLGACGDLGPRDGFVGDVTVADRNGRQLGHAVLSALASLGPAATEFRYRGPVISGATLGTWFHAPLGEEQRIRASRFTVRQVIVPLRYIDNRPALEQLQSERAVAQARVQEASQSGDEIQLRDSRAIVERLSRAITRWSGCPAGDVFPYELSLLRMGAAVWIAGEGELYQWLQLELRRRFPDAALVIMMLGNGWRCSYLPTRETYGQGIYQEQIAMLAPGCLEAVLEAASTAVTELLADR